ncbi:chaplin [Streptomyces sp. NBC_01353]|uniref:chaplin n=1 Tax=Streptomyces sp. NBC_01353 TaxID=2903835 RepID=UPI002E34A854|nr:chaplin [Streptomyces sp. NBC_01353]
MRQIRRSGLATLMVTGGALALSAGAAHADSGAQGAAVGSPGVISGNTVQLPVHVPVNVCGNTVNVIGLLNPAAGNRCANVSTSDGYGSDADGGGRTHKDMPGTPRAGAPGGGANNGGHSGGNSSNGGGALAEGHAVGSPGVLSGNGLQLPIDLPVNVAGNSVNVVGIGNPAIGNTAVNGPSQPEEPGEGPGEEPNRNVPFKPQPVPVTDTETEPQAPTPGPQTSSVALASTGSELVGSAAAAGAALLLGGALVYRRARRMGAQV